MARRWRQRWEGRRSGIGGDIADTRVHNVRATAAYTYVKITAEAERKGTGTPVDGEGYGGGGRPRAPATDIT